MLDKSDLRREALVRRSSFASSGFAAALAAHAGALPPAAVVAGYAAFRDEADPSLLLQALAARGAVLCLPRMAGRTAPLVFHCWQPGDVLQAHKFGVDEPLASAPVVEPDVVLVPLLAFDGEGYRLGYGGGFYDRTLAALRARRPVRAIGVAYAGQQLEAVPHDGFDQRLDGVLSENGLVTFVR